MAWLSLPFRCHHTFSTKENGCQFFIENNNDIHKYREVWCHVELNAVKKDNYVADYKMDNNNICNDKGHIQHEINMMWRMMDVEDVNSEVVAEDIEEYPKYQQHHLAEQQQHLLKKYQHKLAEKQS